MSQISGSSYGWLCTRHLTQEPVWCILCGAASTTKSSNTLEGMYEIVGCLKMCCVHCRAMAQLEEAAAPQGEQPPGRVCSAYCVLAQHLPLHQAAAAALGLLDHSAQQHGMPAAQWRTEHGLQVAAGLLKHRAVRADAASALRQPQTSSKPTIITAHL